MECKLIYKLCCLFGCLIAAISFVVSNCQGKCKESELITFSVDDKTFSPLKFEFIPLKLTQGCDSGELPYHFFTHPDDKNGKGVLNPGIISYRDFVVWAGADFPEKAPWPSSSHSLTKPDSLDVSFEDLGIKLLANGRNGGVDFPTVSIHFSRKVGSRAQEYEEKGIKFVTSLAKTGNCYFQTILAGYYFYLGNTKKGLFWAEKAAEAGETGGMKILGDAYMYGIGVIQDDVEGLKWYQIATALGNLAANGELLTRCRLPGDPPLQNVESWREANKQAKEWMEIHKELFISDV